MSERGLRAGGARGRGARGRGRRRTSPTSTTPGCSRSVPAAATAASVSSRPRTRALGGIPVAVLGLAGYLAIAAAAARRRARPRALRGRGAGRRRIRLQRLPHVSRAVRHRRHLPVVRRERRAPHAPRGAHRVAPARHRPRIHRAAGRFSGHVAPPAERSVCHTTFTNRSSPVLSLPARRPSCCSPPLRRAPPSRMRSSSRRHPSAAGSSPISRRSCRSRSTRRSAGRRAPCACTTPRASASTTAGRLTPRAAGRPSVSA